jgi:hypothetical protein
MARERNNVFNNLDWTLVIIYLVLVLMGWLNIFMLPYTTKIIRVFST